MSSIRRLSRANLNRCSKTQYKFMLSLDSLVLNREEYLEKNCVHAPDERTQLNAIRMNDQPLVSVIVPCYNAERWIGASIASALEQTYTSVEVVVGTMTVRRTAVLGKSNDLAIVSSRKQARTEETARCETAGCNCQRRVRSILRF